MLNPAVPRVVLACLYAFAAGSSPAQTPRKSGARPANVQTGTIAAIDGSDGSLKLKSKAGTEIAYRLTEKTRFYRDKKAVEAAAFKPGDSATVRFRKSSVGPATVYDLADRASWEWLSRIRKDPTEVKVVEIDEETLKAAEGADKSEIEYRITDKTAWSKAGKPASAADFKPGDRAVVVPRMLPSGGIMATAVSDSAAGAAVLKEHAKSTVSGAVKAIDSAKKTLALRTAAGEDRALTLAADCTAHMGSRDVPLTTVHAGQQVTVHLVRDDDGSQQVSRINIASKRTPHAKRSAAPSPKVPQKPTAKPE